MDEVGRLCLVGGIFPVDVQAVEAEVLDEADGGGGECLPAMRRGCWEGEVGGVGPSADGEDDFKMPMGLFEEEELLKAAIEVGARFGPRVRGVVLCKEGEELGIIRKKGWTGKEEAN